MRLRLPLLVLLVAVAVLLTQWAPGPGGPGPGPGTEGLPPEAEESLRLIERGGRFPHHQDGTVFENRERLLPVRARG